MAGGPLTHPHSEAVSVKMQTVLPSVIQSWAETDSCQTWKSASWHDLSLLIWRFCVTVPTLPALRGSSGWLLLLLPYGTL